MGNRIIFDEIRQQLSSIYRVAIRSLQNEVQNDSPYLVRNRQFTCSSLSSLLLYGWSVCLYVPLYP